MLRNKEDKKKKKERNKEDRNMSNMLNKCSWKWKDNGAEAVFEDMTENFPELMRQFTDWQSPANPKYNK